MKLRKILDKGDPNNKKIAYNFFVKEKGYSPEVALGIVGNLMQESHANLDTSAIGFDGTGSFGIAQWLGPRKKKLKQIRPDDFNTLRGQLEFIDWELNNTEKRAASKLKGAKTVEDATVIFSKYYERPHKDYAHNNKRISYATNLSKELGVTVSTRGREEKFMANLVKQRQVAIDNTAVKMPKPPPLATQPIIPNSLPNYTTINGNTPNSEVKEQKSQGIDEEQLRQILSQEREATEKRFLNVFNQQEQITQQEYEPQSQTEDLSHLYNYIKLED